MGRLYLGVLFILGVSALHEENVFDRFHTVFSLLSLYGYTLSVICWICFGRLERYLWACRALGRIRLSFFVVDFSFSLPLCISLVLFFLPFSSKLLFHNFFFFNFFSRHTCPPFSGFAYYLSFAEGFLRAWEFGRRWDEDGTWTNSFLVNTQQ